MSVDSAALRARLASVRDRIADAAGRAGRNPATIRLVAISKTFSADYVRAAADEGQVDFGENKVQEALLKIQATSGRGLRWHLVGHLQSNKARKAAEAFDVVHSADDEGLISRLDDAAGAAGRRVDVLVQVDLAQEPTKHGVPAEGVAAVCRAFENRHALALRGLMLLPPAVGEPDQARPYFARLRELRDRLVEAGIPRDSLGELSMGMSHDFEVAIEEGATMVRVGSAIFGAR